MQTWLKYWQWEMLQETFQNCNTLGVWSTIPATDKGKQM